MHCPDPTATSLDFDTPLTRAVGARAPLAYLLATPIADPPNPGTIPRLSSHPEIITYSSCDSAEWCGCLYVIR